MKTVPRVVALISAFLITTTPALAGGLIQKLPKDGAWIRYTITFKQTGPYERESTLDATLKLVGTTMHGGEKCRWVEWKNILSDGGKASTSILKLLIREADLKAGAKPVVRIIRAFHRDPRGNVVEWKQDQVSQSTHGTLMFGAIKKPKTIKSARTIEYQKGKLKITSAVTGEIALKWPGKLPADARHVVTRTIWKHKSVPFGAAVVEMKRQFFLKDKVTATTTTTHVVQDFGTGAKSALPDKK